MLAPGSTINASGRLVCTGADGVVPDFINQGLGFKNDGSLCMDTGTPAGSLYHAGVRISSRGAPYVTDTQSVDDLYVGGLRISALGALVFTNDGTTLLYENGNPVAANGTLSVTGVSTAPPDTPTVLSITDTISAAAASSHALTMPGTIVAGDLLLVVLATHHQTIDSLTGWTQIFSRVTANNVSKGYFKVAAGGDTGTVVLSGSAMLAGRMYRIQAGSFDAAHVGGDSSGATADPPSLTPSWGAAKNLWIASLSDFGTGWTATTSYPLSDGQSTIHTPDGGAGGDGEASLATCSVNSTGASLDPAAFTVTGSLTGSQIAATLAVGPA